MNPLLTKDDVCEKLNIPPGTLRHIMERRELPYVKIGGCVRFSEDDIQDYVMRMKIRTKQYAAPAEIVSQARNNRPRSTANVGGYVPGMKVV